MKDAILIALAISSIGLLFKIVFDWLKPKKQDCPCNWIKDFEEKVVGKETRYDMRKHFEESTKNTTIYKAASEGVRRMEAATNTQNNLLNQIIEVLKQNGDRLDRWIDKGK